MITDSGYNGSLSEGAAAQLRDLVNVLEAAADERDLRALIHLEFESLGGNRAGLSSMTLPEGYEVICKVEEGVVTINAIELRKQEASRLANDEPAVGTHPGVILKREIDKRGWSQADLAPYSADPYR